MSVRSTSFVGSYDPSGIPGPGKLNNNPQAAKRLPSDHPPPLPPGREKEEPLYQDIDEYTRPGGEAAYQAYLNPTFKGKEDVSPAGKGIDTPAGNGNSSPRYVHAKAKQVPNVKPKPKAKPKPFKPPQTPVSNNSNDGYLPPKHLAAAEQDYMALRVGVP